MGIDVIGPTNHDDFILSIYFYDPSGHRLELTASTCEKDRHRTFENEAYDILDLWNETHDWSQREKIFGGQTGYKKD
jgi:hypothetical protein